MIVTMTLDPNAAAYTDDQIVAKINAATSQITRATAIDADALNLIKTEPTTGEFKVKSVHRDATGKLGVKYDNVAV
jgi:ABC-type enterochelin transport system permease subunit